MNRQNLSTIRVEYPNQSFDAALSAPSNQQLLLSSVTAYNGLPAINDVGIATSVTSDQWFLESTTGADLTAEIQAGETVTIFPIATDEGYVVRGKSKFDLISFNVSTAETGSPAYTYEYWNGSTWNILPLLQPVSYASTGLVAVLFSAPLDWIADADSLFTIKVTATSVSVVQINSLKVCEVLVYRESVLPYGHVACLFENTRQLLLQQGESVIGFFALPSSLNTMEATYQINP